MSVLVVKPVPLPALHEAYNTLPDFFTALPLFTDKVDELIRGPIRQVFLDHKVAEKYGLCFNHKHFDIVASERLVEHGPSTSPWSVGTSQDFVAELPGGTGWVKPRSYRLVEGGHAVPYEFAYTAKAPDTKVSAEDTAFFHVLANLLKKHDLLDLLGVRDLSTRDEELTLEVTQGRNNVLIHPGNWPEAQKATTLWTFREVAVDEDGIYNAGSCRALVCNKGNKNHGHGWVDAFA